MQYFKDKIGSTGLLFLQETHSDSKVEQTWKEDFKDFTGTFIVKKQQTDKERRILILDVSINDSEYILINLYNTETENRCNEQFV